MHIRDSPANAFIIFLIYAAVPTLSEVCFESSLNIITKSSSLKIKLIGIKLKFSRSYLKKLVLLYILNQIMEVLYIEYIVETDIYLGEFLESQPRNR